MAEILPVIEPSKIVTDELVLRELNRQDIDFRFVEFWKDYGSRSLGLSPYAKQYRDLKSGKRFYIASGLPMCNSQGQKFELTWIPKGRKFLAQYNLFDAVVDKTSVQLTCLSDQPTDIKQNDQAIWHPQL